MSDPVSEANGSLAPNAPTDVGSPDTTTPLTEEADRLSVREIWDAADFHTLHRDWNALQADTVEDSVFLRHEWFDAAWLWQDPATRPLVLAWYRAGRLTGAAALALWPERRGGLPLRALGFLTVPDTQECGLVAAAKDRGLIFTAFARWLRHNRHRWDVLRLRGLPGASRTREHLADHLARQGLPTAPAEPEPNYCIGLTGTWDGFYTTRSRKLKKNNNLVANRLNAAGDVQLTWHRGEAAPEDVLAQAVTVSAQSWKADLGMSLDRPGPNAFIQRLSDHARRNGWLSIWLLTLDGQPVAMEYQLIHGGRVHALRGDFVDRFEDLSPGAHLNHRIIRALFEDAEATTYLMGPGSNAYKRRWTDEAESLEGLWAYSRTMRGQWLQLWDQHLRPMARKMRDGAIRYASRKQGDRQ